MKTHGKCFSFEVRWWISGQCVSDRYCWKIVPVTTADSRGICGIQSAERLFFKRKKKKAICPTQSDETMAYTVCILQGNLTCQTRKPSNQNPVLQHLCGMKSQLSLNQNFFYPDLLKNKRWTWAGDARRDSGLVLSCCGSRPSAAGTDACERKRGSILNRQACEKTVKGTHTSQSEPTIAPFGITSGGHQCDQNACCINARASRPDPVGSPQAAFRNPRFIIHSDCEGKCIFTQQNTPKISTTSYQQHFLLMVMLKN